MKKIVFTTLAILLFVSSDAQSIRFRQIFNEFCAELKQDTNFFKLDTTNNFGTYQKLVNKFFDIDSMAKNLKRDTAIFSEKLKYQMYQYMIGGIKSYLTYIPENYLSINEGEKGKGLTPEWNNSSKNTEDIEEINMIKNSLILSFNHLGKIIELYIIGFNPSNNKIIFIIPTFNSLSNTAEEIKLVNSFMVDKHPHN